MLTLHRPDTVFSLRHVPSWLMLCFAAGYVNATALLACERFVTHVTGTVTRIGVEVVHLRIMLDFLLVLACFIVGAMTSGLLINGRAHRRRPPLYSAPLWLAAALIASAALLGHQGWFGPFGTSLDEQRDFIFLAALSFAMGLQNAAVATSTGLLVRTTHLTGPATDLGVHLAELLFADGQAKQVAMRHAALRTGKLFAYAFGAALAVPLARAVGFLTLLVPAAIIVSATLLSFLPAAEGAGTPARAPG